MNQKRYFSDLNILTPFLAHILIQHFQVKLPQIIIMIIAIELSVMFGENTRCLSRKKLTKVRLVEFFEQFRRLETVHAQLESTYSTTILIGWFETMFSSKQIKTLFYSSFLVIMCKLTISTVKSYVIIRYLANESGTSFIS